MRPLSYGCEFVLFHLVYNSLEGLGIVNSEVGKHLTVNLDTGLMQCSHKGRIGHVLQASGSVDTLNPQCPERTLLVATVAISVGKTFFPSVFGYSPNIFSGTIVTLCKL